MDKLEPSNTISPDALAELFAMRSATPHQLMILAEKSGLRASVKDDLVLLTDLPGEIWNPQNNLAQNSILLSAVIAAGDCRLFYDDGIHEYFIYQYLYNDDNNPPLAHQTTLQDTTFDAAMNLWHPEKE